jgi:hypothetical protein
MMTDLSKPFVNSLKINRPDGSYMVSVRCPWCEFYHYHSMSEQICDEGYMKASKMLVKQCCNKVSFLPAPNSPLTHYIPIITKEITEEKHNRLYKYSKLGRRFQDLMTIEVKELQQFFIKTLFQKKRRNDTQKFKLNDGTLLRVTAYGGGVEWDANLNNQQIKNGSNLLSLIAFMYNISEGIATVRLLECLTDHIFDAQGKLEINEAVNNAFKRQTGDVLCNS